MQVNEIVSDIK